MLFATPRGSKPITSYWSSTDELIVLLAYWRTFDTGSPPDHRVHQANRDALRILRLRLKHLDRDGFAVGFRVVEGHLVLRALIEPSHADHVTDWPYSRQFCLVVTRAAITVVPDPNRPQPVAPSRVARRRG